MCMQYNTVLVAEQPLSKPFNKCTPHEQRHCVAAACFALVRSEIVAQET